MTIDTIRRVETPEGVEIELRVAGPTVRARAWAIDAVVRYGAAICAGGALSVFDKVGHGIYLLVAFALSWLYPILFEVLRNGQTIGKSACGIQVVRDDGAPVGWSRSTLRNTVRFADILPAAYGIGLASSLAHPEFRRLGDLAAGTVVVHRDLGGTKPSSRAVEPVMPGHRLRIEEQRAILEFSERVDLLTVERAAELAEAAGVVGGRGLDGVHRLLGIAAWLEGRR